MIAFSLKTSVKSYQNPAKPGLKIYFSYSTIRKPDTISTYLTSPATYAILGDWTHEPLSVPSRACFERVVHLYLSGRWRDKLRIPNSHLQRII